MKENICWSSKLLIIFVLLLKNGETGALVQLSPTSLRRTRTAGPYKKLENDCPDQQIPFLIERLSSKPNSRVFREITDVCIEAFFNDGPPGRSLPPWKECQLAYLRSLQQGDLRMRRERDFDKNMMFVARRVIPASDIHNAVQKMPLILDLSSVYNLSPASKEEYVRGEIIAFVEVTKKPYGLGDWYGHENGPYTKADVARPVLTNLAVKYDARKAGVGSKLLDKCEKCVLEDWKMNEIILEVEEENLNAQKWYEKRGYTVLFEDPTSRRYDVNGFWLRRVRCRRKIMRKVLGLPFSSTHGKVDSISSGGVFQRLRDRFMGIL